MQDEKKIDTTSISRRRFLQGVSAGTVATLVVQPRRLSGMGLSAVASTGSRSFVQIDRSRVPILAKADVVIAGGSLAGVSAAAEFARHGLKVVLVEHRNYLGREVAAPLKPWIDLGELTEPAEVPEPIAFCLKKMDVKPQAGEMALGMDAFKLSLEELLLDSHVELVYSSLPTEVISANGVIHGIVIGNKSGRQALLASTVIDATSSALVARLAGARFDPETADDFQFVRVLEMENVESLSQDSVQVPAELGIAGNHLRIHPGYGFKGHILIECPMELKLGKMDLEGMMQREIEARHRSMRVASYLIQNVPAFHSAKLAIAGYELDGPQTTRLCAAQPDWAAGLQRLSFTDKKRKQVSLTLATFAGPVKNLWCVNEAARLQGASVDLARDPVNASLLGKAVAQAVSSMLAKEEGTPAVMEYSIPHRVPHALEVKLQETPQRGRHYEKLMVPPVEVPVFRDVDVLVVGAGTSGATCANAAGREGAKTVVLELNPGLGGTATLGGVCAYWYGRYWAGFAIRNSQLVDEVHKTINWPTSANKLNGRWNIEAKMYALLKDATDAGVDVLFSATTIATVVRDNQVRGVVAATPYGPLAVLARNTVDATGDGDVAAFAGARFTFGSARDHYPMWYNLAEYTTPTESRWHFAHTVDVTNVEDTTRALLISRRSGPKCFDHGNYIATRESRHIIGDVVVTLTDMLRHRPFPDIVNLGAGQMDCHRRITSDWLRAGLLIPILPTEMPYRALLPQGLDNILVVGKAVSLVHDAMYNMRNQPEMENLGGAAGVAAAYAAHEGVGVRKVDLPRVQKRLTEIGTLLPDMLTRSIEETHYDEAAIHDLVKQLDGRHLAAWFNVPMAREGTPRFREKIPFVEICSSDPRLSVPILKEELAMATGDRRLRLAQALAMFGSPEGVPVLIAAIEHRLANGMVAVRMNKSPEAGSIEGLEWGIPFPPADLVYSLGMARDPRALAVWDKVAEATNPEPTDFADELPWPYHFVDSVCYGAELLGDPAAIPILKKLHGRSTLCRQSVKEGVVVDFNLDKRALIEVTLGRALASLGAAEGYEILIDYLNDVRANQAEFAHMTLEYLTGIDNGKDPGAWRRWLDSSRNSLKPVPLLERGEGPDATGPYYDQVTSLEVLGKRPKQEARV